jgi:hypothetical protein
VPISAPTMPRFVLISSVCLSICLSLSISHKRFVDVAVLQNKQTCRRTYKTPAFVDCLETQCLAVSLYIKRGCHIRCHWCEISEAFMCFVLSFNKTCG